MDPLGFTERAVNLVLVSGTHALPGVITIGDLTEQTDALDEDGFAETLRMLRRELGVDRISALVSRPGTAGPTAADLAWVRLAQAAAAKASIASGLAYLATDTELRPVRTDDVG